MPDKKKYASLKNNPQRLAAKRDYCKLWKRKQKIRRPFVFLSQRLKNAYKTIIPPMVLFGLAKRQKLICPITGRKLTGETMSIDHIIPLKRGGQTEISNLQLVDYNANLAKHTMSIEQLVCLCKDIVNHQSSV